jgi:hypothetical protein
MLETRRPLQGATRFSIFVATTMLCPLQRRLNTESSTADGGNCIATRNNRHRKELRID